MFSWSLKWIWAQCLLIGAGLFLLAHMAAPNSSSLTTVRGTLEEIGSRSRKGLGSFYELRLITAGGQIERVLVGRNDVASSSVQRLVGRKIVARVNGSSEVIDLIIDCDGSEVISSVNSSATSRSRSFNMVGWIATILGLIVGAATLSASPIARRLSARVCKN